MSDKAANADARKQRFNEIEREARVLAEAYRLRLVGRLWWANLAFVVLPAVFATGAAIFAAAGGTGEFVNKSRGLAAVLAGLAAVLSAVHKSLKCEEYQTECQRLGPAYDAIAEWADSAQISPEQDDPRFDELKNLTEKFATLKESARAPLPDKYIKKARAQIQTLSKARSPAPERGA
jgi:hypothetical protein